MDIAEKMAADIALNMDGGEWKDGKWYSKCHRDAWIKAVKPYADEIERLREENEYLKAQAIHEQHKAESEGEERGYRMGYVDGHSDGAETESEAFRRGYDEGLADGMGTE